MREMCNLKATQRQSITRSPAPGPNPITASLHLRHSLAQRLEALLELLDEHVQHVVYDRLAAAAQLRTARDDRPRRPEKQPVEAAQPCAPRCAASSCALRYTSWMYGSGIGEAVGAAGAGACAVADGDADADGAGGGGTGTTIDAEAGTAGGTATGRAAALCTSTGAGGGTKAGAPAGVRTAGRGIADGCGVPERGGVGGGAEMESCMTTSTGTVGLRCSADDTGGVTTGAERLERGVGSNGRMG